MQLTVNGLAAEVEADLTVAGLVRARAEELRRIAVAVNGDVVPRGSWETTRLATGDSVEVLAPVAGG